MTRFDTIIRGGILVTPAGLSRADLGITGGLVSAVAPELEGGAARRSMPRACTSCRG